MVENLRKKIYSGKFYEKKKIILENFTKKFYSGKLYKK